MNIYPPSIGGPPPQGGDQGYTNNNNVQQGQDPWRHYSQSQSHAPMMKNYNRGQRDNYTQSADVPDNAFSNQQANNAINNTRKRAAKRRVKHDLPGPAGSWFRKNSKRPPKKAKALLLSTKKGIIKSEEQDNNIGNGGEHINNQDGTSSNVDVSQQQQQYTTSDVKSPDKVKSDPDNNINSPSQNKKQQQEQLFHDHSSDLHESSSWNIMCSTLNRIVPPSNLLLSSTQNISATYKHILRKHISNEYALISEIHEGKYDTNHIGCTVGQNEGDVGLFANDLRLPTLIGYVASVQCHAHSDWTALLVDEMQSVGSGGSSSSSNNGKGGVTNGIGKGVMCWVEEKLVKQHGGWIRPGVVWMIEGAKLALFNSTCEEDDIEEDDDDDTGINGNSLGTDISPSTDHVRGGGNINRMILVGESSLVYAWTPEEAASTFSHDEFVSLTEKRLNLGLPGVIDNVIDVDKAHDVKPVVKSAVDQNPSLLEIAKVNVASSKPSDLIDIDKDDEEVAGKNKSEDTVGKTPGANSTTKSQTPLSVSGVRKDPKSAAVYSLSNEDIIETIPSNQHTAETQSEVIIPQVTAASLTERVTQNIQHSPATEKEEGEVVELETEGEDTRKQPIVAKQGESRSTLEVDPSHDLDASANVNKVESNRKAVKSPLLSQSVKKVNPKTSDNDPLGLSKFKATAKPPPSQHVTSNIVSTTQTHNKSVEQQAKATRNPYAKENSKANGTSISNELQRPIQLVDASEDNKTKTDKEEPTVNKPEATPPRQVPPDQARKATSNKPHTSSGLTPSQSMDQVTFSESSSSDKGPSTNNVKSNDSFDDMLDEEISEDMVAKISHLTPKELIKRQSPKYTGDSFDDMLDEDDGDMFVDLATGNTLDKSDVNLAKTEVPVAKSNEISTSNPAVVSAAQAPSSSPFALSSLDDEDLDMLDED